jgi:hypothetical protein
MFVVFDLDGTLALTEHRSHFLTGPGPKDWRGFYAACDQDQPNLPIIATLIELGESHDVEIWSGRSDEVRDKTEAWLERHQLDTVRLRMRAAGDHRPDTILKAEWLDEGRKPDLVFEDRTSMVAMYRARGIVCCQVAPGDF